MLQRKEQGKRGSVSVIMYMRVCVYEEVKLYESLGKQKAADLIQSKVKCLCVLTDRGQPMSANLKCISILKGTYYAFLYFESYL